MIIDLRVGPDMIPPAAIPACDLAARGTPEAQAVDEVLFVG